MVRLYLIDWQLHSRFDIEAINSVELIYLKILPVRGSWKIPTTPVKHGLS